MVGVKLFELHFHSIDPFRSSQDYAWRLLTCLSMTHPHREVGLMTWGSIGEGSREKEGGDKGTKNGSGSTEKDSVVDSSKEAVEHPKSD